MSYISPRPRWAVKKADLRALPEHTNPRPSKKKETTLTASRDIIGDSDILSLTIWKNGKKAFRVYMDKTEQRDITYDYLNQRWSEGDISHNMVNVAGVYSCYLGSLNKYIHVPNDAAAVIADYFGDTTTAPLVRIQRQFKDNRSTRYANRTADRRQIAQHIADQRKPLPKNFSRWVDYHLFTDERYLVYRREKKNIVGRCTFCGAAVEMQAKKGMRHGSTVKCLSCGKIVQLCSPGRYKSSTLRTHKHAIVANRIDEGLLLRCIMVSRITNLITAEKKDIIHDELALYVVSPTGRDISLELKVDYHTRKDVWDKAKPASSCYTPFFRAGLLYTGNLHTELKGTKWQYSALELLPNVASNVTGEIISSYLDGALRHPEVERLMKAGFYKLAVGTDLYWTAPYPTGITQPGASKLHQLLGVHRCDLPMLRRLNPDHHDLELYREVIGRINDLPAFMKKSIPLKNTRTLLTICRETSPITVERLVMEYAPQQMKLSPHVYGSVGAVFGDYLDYVRQCASVNRNMDDTSNRWPADLNVRHTQLSNLIKREKQLIKDKQMRHRWKTEHKKYEYTSSGFTVLMPKNQTEIFNEGKAMCHCVATYADRAARGETTILFIRSTADRRIPLATAEVRDGTVIQIRGYKNTEPSPEVMAFWKKYVEKVLKPMSKVSRLKTAG